MVHQAIELVRQALSENVTRPRRMSPVPVLGLRSDTTFFMFCRFWNFLGFLVIFQLLFLLYGLRPKVDVPIHVKWKQTQTKTISTGKRIFSFKKRGPPARRAIIHPANQCYCWYSFSSSLISLVPLTTFVSPNSCASRVLLSLPHRICFLWTVWSVL